jgi:hypothetical protein
MFPVSTVFTVCFVLFVIGMLFGLVWKVMLKTVDSEHYWQVEPPPLLLLLRVVPQPLLQVRSTAWTTDAHVDMPVYHL